MVNFLKIEGHMVNFERVEGHLMEKNHLRVFDEISVFFSNVVGYIFLCKHDSIWNLT